MLFSSDCHIGLLTDNYPTYIDPQYKDQLADFLSSDRRHKPIVFTGPASETARANRELRGIFASQPDKRVAALEEDGYVAEVLFPDSGNSGADNAIPFGEHFGGIGDYDPELHAASLRAYNRWLGESVVRGRQAGLGLIPLLDPEYAAEQAKTLRPLGLSGVMPSWDGIDLTFPPFYDERFDPLWAVLADEGLPVTFHASSGVPERMYAGLRGSPRGRLANGAEGNFWSRRPLWQMIFGGVLERHPKLRVGFAELFSDWIPRTLAFMDWSWEIRYEESTREICPLRPSEYWARQCFVGASPISRLEAEIADEFAPGTLTCGTDFPHTVSPWGKIREYLQATVGAAHVPEAEARKILGENVARIFGFDLANLNEIAERVGPTVDEILNPPAGVDPTEGMAGFIRAEVNRPLSIL